MVSGAFRVEMKGEKPAVLHAGDCAFVPPHHIHQGKCLGPAACIWFRNTDRPFDIHWVNEAGQEISLEQAIEAAKGAAPRPKQRR